MNTPWKELFQNRSINEKVENFHNCLKKNLDKHFPEKMTKMSCLDRDWMTPELKQLHRSLQREFYKHRKSEKYKKMKMRFKKLKRKTVKNMYSDFIKDLKATNPSKWYGMAKKIGAVNKSSGGNIKVESLSEYNDIQCAQKIAEHFPPYLMSTAQ